MGDTIIKWFSDLTNWVASLTVLPGEGGFRLTVRQSMEALNNSIRDLVKSFTGPGIFGDAPPEHERKMDHSEYENQMLDRLAERLTSHIGDEDPRKGEGPSEKMDDLERDVVFYHYVLARECRNLQKDLDASPPKNYEWSEWEYYLKLMGNEDDPTDFPGQRQPDIMVPAPLRAPKGMNADRVAEEKRESDNTEVSPSEGALSGNDPPVDGNIDRKTSVMRKMDGRRKESKERRRKESDQYSDYLLDWSWLSNASPLMSEMSETQWILDRLSAALERELNRQMRGYRTKPPIGLKDARRSSTTKDSAENEARSKKEHKLAKAARSEE
jgi:potassium channel subfamily K